MKPEDILDGARVSFQREADGVGAAAQVDSRLEQYDVVLRLGKWMPVKPGTQQPNLTTRRRDRCMSYSWLL